MAWIISTHNDEQDRDEFVRRITPEFVSWTVDRADAARWDSKREVSKAATQLRRLSPGVAVVKPWQAPADDEAAPAPAVDPFGAYNPL